MITIKVYGLDPYLLRDISSFATKPLADIFECNIDDINFVGFDSLVVHNGVEQNTRNVFIEVLAPQKVSVIEDETYDVIESFFKDFCINLEVTFIYFSSDNYHVHINNEYPRFMSEDEADKIYDYKVGQDCDEHEHNEENHEEEEEDEEDIYLGNAFEGIFPDYED